MLNGKIEVTEDVNKFQGQEDSWPEPGTLVVMPDRYYIPGAKCFVVLEVVEEAATHEPVEHRGLFWDKETAVMFAASLIKRKVNPNDAPQRAYDLLFEILNSPEWDNMPASVVERLEEVQEILEVEIELSKVGG